MSITRLTTNGLTGTKYDTVSADNYYMEPIATTLLSGTSAAVTFSNIPQNYKNLQVRMLAQETRATYGVGGFTMQYNSDTGSNYSQHLLYGDGASAIAAAGASQSSMLTGYAGTNTGGTFSGVIIDILDYANVYKYKTSRSLFGVDLNGTVGGIGGYVGMASGLWMNTAAITSIVLTPSFSPFTANSRFSLYGIRG